MSNYRRIAFDRVIQAIDVETGELVDVRDVCGLPKRPEQRLEKPMAQTRPTPTKRSKRTKEETRALTAQRNLDRNGFEFTYRFEVIYKHFFWRLWKQFSGRCYACGSTNAFTLDHHVPLIAGGRRESGIIVLLCDQCNTRKRDTMPKDFYSADELATPRRRRNRWRKQPEQTDGRDSSSHGEADIGDNLLPGSHHEVSCGAAVSQPICGRLAFWKTAKAPR